MSSFKKRIRGVIAELDEDKVRKHHKLAVELKDALDEILEGIEDKKAKEARAKEFEPYKNETKEQLIDRVADEDEWAYQPQEEEEDAIDYAQKCTVGGGDCWYKGNLDRAGGCRMFRLKGTDNHFVCDVCLCNGGLESYGEDIFRGIAP